MNAVVAWLRCLFACVLALCPLSQTAAAKDELVVAMTQSPATLNPLINLTMAQALVHGMTARPLTAYDASWHLTCLLCAELPTLENGMARVVDLGGGKKGMQVDITLRPMRWGDGVPVTTRDVAFTFEVGKHPGSGVTSAEGYNRVVRLDVRDDHRFSMTLDSVRFDYNDLGYQLVPAHIEKPIFDANPEEYRKRTAYDTDPRNPGLAFGPFHIVELVAGNRIVLERNPTWTGPSPHFRRIVVKIAENTAALQAALLSGDVDYAFGELGLSLDQALGIEKRQAGRYDIVYKPSLSYEHIDVNLDNPLLADRRVRRALLMAIDRQAISHKLFEDRQPVANASVSELDPMFNPNVHRYRYDPAASSRLLTEAGFATLRDGVRVNAQGEPLSFDIVTTAGNRVREQVAQVIQSQLRQVGVDLRIKAQPPRLFSETMTRRTFTALAMYAWIQRPQGVSRSTLHSSEIPGPATSWSGQNFPGYRNPDMDRILDALGHELDQDRRKRLFADLQDLYAEDLPALPLFFRVDAYVVPKPLKGIVPTGHYNPTTLWIENWRWEN